MNKRLTRRSMTALLAILAFAIAAIAQNSAIADVATGTAVTTATQSSPTSPSEFKGIKIKNFGQMDAGFYRGAQPLQEDYQTLKDLGIKTIIDLRDDPTDYAKPTVEALGMKYVNIPMSGWRSPKMESINKFLEIMNNPETGPVYVHCKAGMHRTGVVGAAYRYTKYGWNYDQALQEMKNYNFSSGFTHGKLKEFIKDWGEKLESEKAARAAVSSTAAVGAKPAN